MGKAQYLLRTLTFIISILMDITMLALSDGYSLTNGNYLRTISDISQLIQIYRHSNLSSTTYTNVTNRVYNRIVSEYDGDINSVFLDIDGSCSGVRKSQVASLSPYFNTYRCIEKPSWNAQVFCPIIKNNMSRYVTKKWVISLSTI